MDTILAILNRPETATAVLTASVLLRDRLPGSVVTLFHPRPDIDPDFMPTEEIMTPDRSQRFATERDAITARLIADAAAAGLGPVTILEGRVREIVARQAGSTRLVVVGAAGPHRYGEARDAIDAVLFDAGAPLLLIPPAPPSVLGRNIALAWERSPAADNAVEAALPLLLAARQVTILVAREGHARAHLPNGLIDAMRQRGAAPSVRPFDLDGRDIGDAILEEAGLVFADLLVMGAFTHSRTLEALFGSATREVLAGATLPVLLHH